MRWIKITGGLGNQMFIYAFYLQMRKRFPNTRIDLTDMLKYNAHNGYELQRVFGISDNEVRLPQWLKKTIEFLFFKTIIERKQNLETMEAYKKDYLYPLIYFKGFYQSERFFADVANEVRQAFTFNKKMANSSTLAMLHDIDTNEHSVSLHVRRGDYMEPKFYERYGKVCTLEYYQRAIDHMLSINSQAKFYVFSNDIDWVKQNLNIANVAFIDFNQGKDSWQDMMLMSHCRHNVICNSSFSWWGAWLNPNPEKVVIAPKRWYSDIEAPYITPNSWIRL
jgi:hypothetical protein